MAYRTGCTCTAAASTDSSSAQFRNVPRHASCAGNPFWQIIIIDGRGGWVILLRCLAGVTRNENPFGELFECKKDQERRKWRGKERNGAHGFRPNSLYRYVMYVCMYGFTLPPPPPPPPPSLVHGHSTTVTGVSFGLQQRQQQQHQQFRGAAEGPRYTPRHIRPKETQRLATRL